VENTKPFLTPLTDLSTLMFLRNVETDKLIGYTSLEEDNIITPDEFYLSNKPEQRRRLILKAFSDLTYSDQTVEEDPSFQMWVNNFKLARFFYNKLRETYPDYVVRIWDVCCTVEDISYSSIEGNKRGQRILIFPYIPNALNMSQRFEIAFPNKLPIQYYVSNQILCFLMDEKSDWEYRVIYDINTPLNCIPRNAFLSRGMVVSVSMDNAQMVSLT